MMKSFICLSLLIFFPLIAVVESGRLGGWKQIKDVTDSTVVEIGKYAVEEHNKETKSNLVFDKVVRGKEKVVSGKMYDLVIAAKSGGGGGGGYSKSYEAVVVERVWEKFRKLESFKEM
ncbi:unnamed protein product [Cochlearia groenlandica]